jgi:glycosyltransferase involved in cell wall biosynthesis
LDDRPVRLGWVTTWNTRCGVATYSQFLVRELRSDRFTTTIFASRQGDPVVADADDVRRCWDGASKPDLAELEAEILSAGIEIAVFQFNFSLFEIHALAGLLDRLAVAGVRTVVVFHSTADVGGVSLAQIRDTLARVDRLLVHGIADLNRLKGFGLIDNVTLFPHGVLARAAQDRAAARASLGLPADATIVASYGFLLPSKGIVELIEALPLLRARHDDTRLLLLNALYPVPESEAVRLDCLERVARHGLSDSVTLITEFLSDEESLALLECADLIVFPYQRTAESASGAVRIGLASGRPVACTALGAFEDVSEVVHSLSGTEAAQIANGIADLLAAPDLLEAKLGAAERWRRAHDWRVLGRRLGGMLRALARDGASAPLRLARTSGEGATVGGGRQ